MNYLSLTPGSSIEDLDDIGATADVESEDLGERGIVKKVIEGEIGAVDEYEACIGCKSKVQVDAEDAIAVECTRCGVMMRRSHCLKSITAKISVTGSDNTTTNLTVFNKQIQEITGHTTGDVKMLLLSSPKVKFNVDANEVVYSVSKI